MQNRRRLKRLKRCERRRLIRWPRSKDSRPERPRPSGTASSTEWGHNRAASLARGRKSRRQNLVPKRFVIRGQRLGLKERDLRVSDKRPCAFLTPPLLIDSGQQIGGGGRCSLTLDRQTHFFRPFHCTRSLIIRIRNAIIQTGRASRTFSKLTVGTTR